MKTKLLSCALVVVLILSMIGCSAGSPSSAVPSASGGSSSTAISQAAPAGGENFNKEGYPIVNDKITLNAMWCIRDVDNIDFDNNSAMQMLEEKTNIAVKVDVVKNNDWNTRVNLMFASGDYPDVMFARSATNSAMGVDYEEYGVVQKLLLPLDDLIAEYMPIYSERAAMEEGILLRLVASDGQMYSVGEMVSQNINTSAHYLMNRTWLEALNLEVPTTVDELTDVLRAFKTRDPNGNGKADEIPYVAMFQHSYAGINSVLPFWGIPSDGQRYFVVDDDRNVQFTPSMNGYREAIEWLHLLYSEGLLDVEAISQDAQMVSTKISEGNVGFFTEWRLLEKKFSDWAVNDVPNLNPAVDNAILINPVAADGYETKLQRTMELASKCAFVTTSNKHVPATMRWLDAQLETETMFTLFCGPEGGRDGNRTSDGWIYNEDGLIVTLDDTQNETATDSYGVTGMFFAPGEYYYSVYQMAPHRAEKTDYCKAYTEAGLMQKYSNTLLDIAPLTSEEITRCSVLLTDIENAVKENLANFITKGITDQSWNAFVQTFDSLHVSEYLEIYQKALDKLEI